MEQHKPVGIWIRVSTEDQARGESPEHHEKRARYYAESKGWQVKEIYHLEAVSGKSVMRHPETQKMLGHIKSGHITGLIFSKLARLARNTKELLDFADIFRQCNCDLISLQEAIDTSSPAGRLFYTMIAAMAQWEREEISDRVAASIPIRAKLGKPLGGQAAFGYQWKDKQLIPSPKEAPIRKLIYELFLEHKRKKTVAKELNESGYRTRNGSKWSDTTVERLLRDTTAKGLRRANWTQGPPEKDKKRIIKPQDAWVYSRIEPIITEELWDKCNCILDDQEKTSKKQTKKTVQLFAGFVLCACGNRMYVPSNSPKYICWKCRNKIGTTDLEDIFHHQLKNFFFSTTEITNYLNQADQVIKEKEELLKTVRDEKKKTEQDMDKMSRAYTSGEISIEGFGRFFKPLEERLKQIDNQIPEIQGEIDFLKIQYLSSDQIFNEAKDLYSRWPQLTSEEKRKIIENITEKIVIGNEDVAIHLTYLPSSFELMAKGQQNARVALPFCHLTLRGRKPIHREKYPDICRTWGDWIRARRIDLNLTKRQLSSNLNVSDITIYLWEKNKVQPSLLQIPKIIEFLGNNPFEKEATDLGDKIREYRRIHGLTQKDFAKQIGIDNTTLASWERSEHTPTKKLLDKIKATFVF